MKRNKKFAILCCALFMTMALTGCQFGVLGGIVSNLGEEETGAEIIGTESSTAVDMGVTDVGNSGSLEDVNSTTQRIGSVETGYVDVPIDFVRFSNDVYLGEGTIQYSDITGQNIVTLQCFDATVIDAETSANVMFGQFESDAMADQESLTGAMVTIDGCEAYQVYCYYPGDDIYVVTWSFDSPHDDYTHYVAVEFTSDNFDLFEMVQNTYRVVDEAQ